MTTTAAMMSSAALTLTTHSLHLLVLVLFLKSSCRGLSHEANTALTFTLLMLFLVNNAHHMCHKLSLILQRFVDVIIVAVLFAVSFFLLGGPCLDPRAYTYASLLLLQDCHITVNHRQVAALLNKKYYQNSNGELYTHLLSATKVMYCVVVGFLIPSPLYLLDWDRGIGENGTCSGAWMMVPVPTLIGGYVGYVVNMIISILSDKYTRKID